jgi:ornithine decarboxylase
MDLTPPSSNDTPSLPLQVLDPATGLTRTDRIDQFLAGRDIPTPFVIIDLNIVRETYRSLAGLFPQATIFYAVKANPTAAVIAALAECGARFDLASEGEIRRCQELGINSDRLSFGNTIKREIEIIRAQQSGIDLFAFDSIGELEKLARAAPGARVFCRMLVESKGAEWPLTRKFGCTPSLAVDLLIRARQLGLRPIGVSFHVGSQQTDPHQWSSAIAAAAGIFRACAHNGLDLGFLNLGGGLPAHYRHPVPSLATYAEIIDDALTKHFSAARPQIMIEPGRGLVGDAGMLRAQVLLVARKSHRATKRWVYLDAGRFNGLPETLDERIQYPIRTQRDAISTGPVVLAGPTCDSVDILYEHADYYLPLDLGIGDHVDFLSAGAYTASYASVEFNGFAPIQTYCI